MEGGPTGSTGAARDGAWSNAVFRRTECSTQLAVRVGLAADGDPPGRESNTNANFTVNRRNGACSPALAAKRLPGNSLRFGRRTAIYGEPPLGCAHECGPSHGGVERSVRRVLRSVRRAGAGRVCHIPRMGATRTKNSVRRSNTLIHDDFLRGVSTRRTSTFVYIGSVNIKPSVGSCRTWSMLFWAFDQLRRIAPALNDFPLDSCGTGWMS